MELGNYLLGKVMEFMGRDQPHALEAIENVCHHDVSSLVYALSPEAWYLMFYCHPILANYLALIAY